MAIDKNRGAKIPVNTREKASQGSMIGLVQPFDSPDRIVNGNPLAVNLLSVTDHPGDGTKPACHTHGSGIGKGRQPALEHARIELIGLAVNVHVAARKMGAHQWIAALNHPAD